jgi:nitrous oxidase accessory protein
MNKNVKRSFVSGLLFALILAAVYIKSGLTVRAASTIIVPDDYSTIQEAINNAADGDTISVKAGTYYEHVVVNKTVSLVGEDSATTVVDANGTGCCFSISRGYVNITGFTIRKSGGVYAQDAGVWIEGIGHCNIFGNNVTENDFFGMSVWGSSSNNITSNSVTKTKGISIHVIAGSNNTVSFNRIEDYYCGINAHAGSNDNRIVANNIKQGDCGILLDNSHDNVISGNIITENRWKYGYNLTDEKYGISIQDDSSGNLVFENYIANNDGDGTRVVERATGNRFYHNNFINNENQAYASAGFTNYWDDGYPSGGNYWSDYNGTDLHNNPYQNETGSDGIGDTPYAIDANNTDIYPLVGMFQSYNVTYFTPPLVAHSSNVTVISNSTVSDFASLIWIEHPEVLMMEFNVTGEQGTTGFCRVSFPTAMMNGTYHVFVNGTEVTYILLPCSNADYSYLYFNYTHSTEEVTITPEFPPFLILPTFMMATLLAVVFCRRKRARKKLQTRF